MNSAGSSGGRPLRRRREMGVHLLHYGCVATRSLDASVRPTTGVIET
jgi:hypothetical protein